MGAYSRGGGLLTIFRSRVGPYSRGGFFEGGGQFEDLWYTLFEGLETSLQLYIIVFSPIKDFIFSQGDVCLNLLVWMCGLFSPCRLLIVYNRSNIHSSKNTE